MKAYRRFKRTHRLAHIAIVAVAIIMFWWAVWNVLDVFLFPEHPFLGYALGFLAAFFILYLDDFHLGELE